jgi:RNA polymerase primary sigma factor
MSFQDPPRDPPNGTAEERPDAGERAREEEALAARFLEEVRRRPPLPLEEELRLGRLVAEGQRAAARLRRGDVPEEERRRLEEAARRGDEARRLLVSHNLRLPALIARRYRWSGIPYLDLVQEGTLGLLRAAERFDWRKGRPFSAYAAWWVRHAISDLVRRETGSVQLPRKAWQRLRRLARARIADPTADWEALGAGEGIDAEETAALVPLLGQTVSLDELVGPERDTALADLLADRRAEEAFDEVLTSVDAARVIRAADRALSPRERRVLERRYGLGGAEPLTLREVGEELGVTPQRVGQIEEAALAKIRRALSGPAA